MGFYNEDEGSRRRKPSTASWLASVVLAAAVGSGATFVTMPLLAKSQFATANSNVAGSNSSGSAKVGTQKSNVMVQGVSTTVNSSIVDAVNKVKPAVVTVVNMQQSGRFSQNSQQQPAGKGSGVVIDNQGHIVTNNHVVEGASQIEIVVNGDSIPAKVLGTDQFTDLAVLQVAVDKLKGIQPVELGSSEALQTGEPAIAIGNPLGEFEQTVTVGVISAKNRKLPVEDQAGNPVYEQTVLQTDAAINPGNSGGALVNVKGQLIGINSAKIASSGVEGLGFSIPIDEAKPIIEQIMSNGKVTRPALGVSVSGDVQDIPENYRDGLPVDYGVVVESATGPAQKAGIQKDDVIVQIDDTKIKTFVDLRKYLFSKQPGDTVKVTFYRGSQQQTASITLQKLSQ